MLKIFTDFHHSGLLNSLIMLFEGRLGGEIYRPIGTDWYKKGFWKIYDHPETIEQFLGIGGATPDGTPRLNEVKERAFIDGGGLYYCKDIDSNEENKAITFDFFMSHHFDIVIASIPQHIEPFRKLCDMHPSKPKLIYQIGNNWNLSPTQELMIDAILASARLVVKPNVPYVEYHQEFDLDVFNPSGSWKTPHSKYITSFVNCFNTDQLFAFDWAIFQEVEKKMIDWQFKAMGGGCRDGAAHGSNELASAMRKSRFIWHTKNAGDGYGHIIHNAAAVGRPLIVRKVYYMGKLGDALMRDGETCITIDNLGIDEIVNKIEYYNNDARYYKICENVYNNFKAKINFDKEAIKIKAFIAQVLKHNVKPSSRLSSLNTHTDRCIDK